MKVRLLGRGACAARLLRASSTLTPRLAGYKCGPAIHIFIHRSREYVVVVDMSEQSEGKANAK